MAPGRKPNPVYARYWAAGCEPALYVFEAGDVVKIGRARSAGSRLQALHRLFVIAGRTPGRFAVLPCDESQLYAGELRLIHKVREAAQPVGNTREFFSGITFEEVVRIAEVETMSHQSPDGPFFARNVQP